MNLEPELLATAVTRVASAAGARGGEESALAEEFPRSKLCLQRSLTPDSEVFVCQESGFAQ